MIEQPGHMEQMHSEASGNISPPSPPTNLPPHEGRMPPRHRDYFPDQAWLVWAAGSLLVLGGSLSAMLWRQDQFPLHPADRGPLLAAMRGPLLVILILYLLGLALDPAGFRMAPRARGSLVAHSALAFLLLAGAWILGSPAPRPDMSWPIWCSQQKTDPISLFFPPLVAWLGFVAAFRLMITSGYRLALQWPAVRAIKPLGRWHLPALLLFAVIAVGALAVGFKLTLGAMPDVSATLAETAKQRADAMARHRQAATDLVHAVTQFLRDEESRQPNVDPDYKQREKPIDAAIAAVESTAAVVARFTGSKAGPLLPLCAGAATEAACPSPDCNFDWKTLVSREDAQRFVDTLAVTRRDAEEEQQKLLMYRKLQQEMGRRGINWQADVHTLGGWAFQNFYDDQRLAGDPPTLEQWFDQEDGHLRDEAGVLRGRHLLRAPKRQWQSWGCTKLSDRDAPACECGVAENQVGEAWECPVYAGASGRLTMLGRIRASFPPGNESWPPCSLDLEFQAPTARAPEAVAPDVIRWDYTGAVQWIGDVSRTTSLHQSPQRVPAPLADNLRWIEVPNWTESASDRPRVQQFWLGRWYQTRANPMRVCVAKKRTPRL